MQPRFQYNAINRINVDDRNPLKQNLSAEHFQGQMQPQPIQQPIRLYSDNLSYAKEQVRRPMSQIQQSRPMNQSMNISREFGNSNPLIQLNPSITGKRMDKNELRDQISNKNQHVKDLQTNFDFFKEETDKRFKDYQDHIRLEIKTKIFDKVLKSNLHYIYKHYENLKNITAYEANKILEANLEKPRKELEDIRITTDALFQANERAESKLKEDILRPNLIKTTKNIVENVDKETISKRLAEIETENKQMEEKLKNLKQWRDQALYDLKFKHEMKGRRAMEERAITLALKHVNPNNMEHRQLEGTVKRLLDEINQKNEIKKSSEVYQLLATKEKLLKQLEAKKNI